MQFLKIFSTILLSIVYSVSQAHETIIWQGAWGNDSFSILCSSIRRSVSAPNNSVNVFLNFPLLLEGAWRPLEDSNQFAEACLFDEKTKKSIHYVSANKDSWINYTKSLKAKAKDSFTVITLGHGTPDRVIGLKEQPGKSDAFPFEYLQNLSDVISDNSQIKYLSDTCFSSNQLDRANEIIKKKSKICGLTSWWNSSHSAGGRGPFRFLDISPKVTLKDLQKNSNFEAIHENVKFDDGIWLSSQNYITKWYEKRNKNKPVKYDKIICEANQKDKFNSIETFFSDTQAILKKIYPPLSSDVLFEFLQNPYRNQIDFSNPIKKETERKLTDFFMTSPLVYSERYAELLNKMVIFFKEASPSEIDEYNQFVACEEKPIFED